MPKGRLRFLGICVALISSVFAWTQVEQLGPIRVDPQTASEGVTIASSSPFAVHSSPQAAKILDTLTSVNGLDPRPSGPWHVELSYDEFDTDGDNVHSGIIEEFYVDATRFRRTIKTDESNQTEVANGSSLYRAGDQSWPKLASLQAIDEVLFPFHRIGTAYFDAKPDQLEWTVGKTRLPCVVLRNGRILSEVGLPKFCYEPGSSVLRYTRGLGLDETAYNNIFHFEQRYVARDVEITHAGKPYLMIHLAKVEMLSQLDSSLLSTPPNSPGPVGEPVRIPGALLTQVPPSVASRPTFPRGVTGRVTVTFTVDKKGHVTKATATDGPKELCKAAEEAVKGLRFRPFLLLDRPVMVESTMLYEIH